MFNTDRMKKKVNFAVCQLLPTNRPKLLISKRATAICTLSQEIPGTYSPSLVLSALQRGRKIYTYQYTVKPFVSEEPLLGGGKQWHCPLHFDSLYATEHSSRSTGARWDKFGPQWWSNTGYRGGQQPNYSKECSAALLLHSQRMPGQTASQNCDTQKACMHNQIYTVTYEWRAPKKGSGSGMLLNAVLCSRVTVRTMDSIIPP